MDIRNAPAKVKTHLRENKQLYVGVGIGVAVSATAVFVVKRPAIIQKAVTYGDNSPIIQIAQPVRRGHPGFVVRIKETGEVVASKRRAKELLGNVSSKKLNDLVEVIGEAQA